MIWLIGLLVLETVLEGLLCSSEYGTHAWPKRLACVFAGVLLATVTIMLSVDIWRVWIWSAPFAAYRIVNLLRVYYGRLPQVRLKAMAMQAFAWLVAAQLGVTLLAWITYKAHWEYMLLDIVAAAQLLAVVILLRSTTNTWRYATVPLDTEPLSDRELPSLSVLVPARNETVALEQCLQLLTASDYPKLEILVLDDCSVTQRTPEIIRDFAQAGVRFIQGGVPDESRWLAKNYAYEQLAQEASGDLLLFCGVDTLLEPKTMRQLVRILIARDKNMLCVMPLRKHADGNGHSLFQAMRYYWELCLPRRFFKRPPVLSTCWLIRAQALNKMGGFEAVSHSVNPEASFARQAVTTDSYSFIRSDDTLGVFSNKPAREQYGTSVRVRYPQLHRRLELVALVAICEVVFLLGPIIGLLLANSLPRTMAYLSVWGLSTLCLLVTYSFASIGTRLSSPWYGWILMPAAFVLDLVVLHISLWKYEFGEVDWKGRNVCLPVMQLPKTNS